MDPDFLERKRRYQQQIITAMNEWPRLDAYGDERLLKLVSDSVVRPADSYGPLQEGECWRPIPTHPADADVDANMREADDMWPNLFAFRDAVRNRGPWDYKQRGGQYENFGNFNYGAAGTAWGFPADILKREAGKANIAAGNSKREWQKYTGRNKSWMLPPYGDDPVDQEWIQRGIDYARRGGMLGANCK